LLLAEEASTDDPAIAIDEIDRDRRYLRFFFSGYA
jgi:hypothetical protein